MSVAVDFRRHSADSQAVKAAGAASSATPIIPHDSGAIVVHVAVNETELRVRWRSPVGEHSRLYPNCADGIERLYEFGQSLSSQVTYTIESVGLHYALAAAMLQVRGASVAITVRTYIGVDVSKGTLDVYCKTLKGEHRKKVRNSPSGADELYEWAQSLPPGTIPVWVMESTGTYHLVAAFVLHGLGSRVVVSNPNRPKAWAVGNGLLNKTDSADAKMLRDWADKCEPREWAPAPPEMLELRALVKRLLQIIENDKRERSRLYENPRVIIHIAVARSILRSLAQNKAERKEVEREIAAFYAAHADLRRSRELLMTIPGVGRVAADNLLCLILHRQLKSAAEAAALCGVVPVHKESGTSLRRRPRISREGDANVRAAIYLPALSATVHDKQTKAFYLALQARGLSKKAALVAVMHQKVRHAFGVLKSGRPFDPKYLEGARMAA